MGVTVELLSRLPGAAAAAPIALGTRNGAPELLDRLGQRLPDRPIRDLPRRLESTFFHLVQHGLYLIRWGDRDPESVAEELRRNPASTGVQRPRLAARPAVGGRHRPEQHVDVQRTRRS